MCGILGIVERHARLTTGLPSAAARMRDALAHRGPDGWGLVMLDGDAVEERSATGPAMRRPRVADAPRAAILGHHRLAIIDLSAGGHQPRSTPDGRFWITYNGEIYNYRELRRDLESIGFRFQSESDTEVLLTLYVREGAKCLERLRGMFAFAIWDDREGTLFLARDRFGIKPLYCSDLPAGPFVFASEPKACLASGLVPADGDPAAAALFLRRGCLPARVSYYRRLTPIPPGHWARWDGDRLATGEYWSLDTTVAAFATRETSADEAGRAVRQALAASVEAHMVSDVPVGVFLSGGLDSTAVVAAAREIHTGTLRTFTVAFPGTPWDESALARQAAARYGTDHTEIALTADRFFADLDRFFDAMDEPTADGVNTFVVARAAREAGLKVVLSGVGGDETLGGYDSFVDVPRLWRWLQAGRAPVARRVLAALVERAPARWAPKVAEMLREPPASLPALWGQYRALFTRSQISALAPGQHAKPAAEFGDPDGGAGDPFWQIARCEIEEFMIPQLLRDADAYTMAWGLELRTPFVDHAFLAAVGAAGRWPRRRGESWKTTIFRHMDGFLPPSHLGRRKQGFTLPFDRWLREALAAARPRDDTFAALLGAPRSRAIVDGFLRGRLHWSRPWALYVLERFRQRRHGHETGATRASP